MEERGVSPDAIKEFYHLVTGQNMDNEIVQFCINFTQMAFQQFARTAVARRLSTRPPGVLDKEDVESAITRLRPPPDRGPPKAAQTPQTPQTPPSLQPPHLRQAPHAPCPTQLHLDRVDAYRQWRATRPA
jgi:hypothetical protein